MLQLLLDANRTMPLLNLGVLLLWFALSCLPLFIVRGHALYATLVIYFAGAMISLWPDSHVAPLRLLQFYLPMLLAISLLVITLGVWHDRRYPQAPVRNGPWIWPLCATLLAAMLCWPKLILMLLPGLVLVGGQALLTSSEFWLGLLAVLVSGVAGNYLLRRLPPPWRWGVALLPPALWLAS